MSKTPMINLVLNNDCSLYLPENDRQALATELRALLAERDVLRRGVGDIKWQRDEYRLRAEKAEAERDALQAQVTPPTRKLREYKGVTYRDGGWWYEGVSYCSASSVCCYGAPFTDADHAPIYALKADPYELVETVEEVLREMYNALGASEIILPGYHEEVITRLRAAVLAEPTRGEG